MKQKATMLIENADWETLLQMAGFLFDEKYLKGLVFSTIIASEDEKINDFVEFFDDVDEDIEAKAELRKDYED